MTWQAFGKMAMALLERTMENSFKQTKSLQIANASKESQTKARIRNPAKLFTLTQQINESRTVNPITTIQNAAFAQPTWIEV